MIDISPRWYSSKTSTPSEIYEKLTKYENVAKNKIKINWSEVIIVRKKMMS